VNENLCRKFVATAMKELSYQTQSIIYSKS